MRRTILIVFAALLAAAPLSSAGGNLFSDPVCAGEGPCVRPAPCVEDYACPPTACSPVMECQGALSTKLNECNDKPESDARTCQTSTELGAAGTHEPGGSTGATLGVTLTDGEVGLENLPNWWDSYGAHVRLVVADADAGTVSAGYYNSDVETSNGSHATQYGATVMWTNEEGSRAGAVLGLVMLDGSPELCFVRTYPDLLGTGGVDCPRALP
jgi:hypothetical protein